jgi:hypothetical protein
MPAACKWIEQLYSGLETADTAKHSPDIPVGKNETVIGEASEGLRRLFAFAQAKHDEAIKLITDTALSPREVRVAAQRDASFIHQEFSLLLKMFWRSLATEFPATRGKHYSIRKDWKIVVWEDDPRNAGLEAALGDLFSDSVAIVRIFRSQGGDLSGPPNQ